MPTPQPPAYGFPQSRQYDIPEVPPTSAPHAPSEHIPPAEVVVGSLVNLFTLEQYQKRGFASKRFASSSLVFTNERVIVQIGPIDSSTYYYPYAAGVAVFIVLVYILAAAGLTGGVIFISAIVAFLVVGVTKRYTTTRQKKNIEGAEPQQILNANERNYEISYDTLEKLWFTRAAKTDSGLG